MKMFTVKLWHLGMTFFVFMLTVFIQQQAAASPFGQGSFGANVPFGSLTSLVISLGTPVNFTVTPSGGYYVGSGNHTVNVQSTDAEGYQLYVRTQSATTTNMTDGTGTQTIAASSNSSPGALATNTWGYSLDSGANYLGMLTTPSLIKTAVGPYKNGDSTRIDYGLKTDLTTGAGVYTVGVVYTVVANNH